MRQVDAAQDDHVCPWAWARRTLRDARGDVRSPRAAVCSRAAAPVVQHRARPDRAEAGPGPRVPGPPSRTARRGGRLTRWSLVGSRHPGRLAQRERVSLTRRRSQVQILYRPPPHRRPSLTRRGPSSCGWAYATSLPAAVPLYLAARRRRWAVSRSIASHRGIHIGSQAGTALPRDGQLPPGFVDVRDAPVGKCFQDRLGLVTLLQIPLDGSALSRPAQRRAGNVGHGDSVGTASLALCAPDDTTQPDSDQPLNLVYGPGGGVKMAWVPMRRQTT